MKLAHVSKPIRRLFAHAQGVAGVEFALILPLMLVMFVGIAQLGQALAIKRKVTITTHTVTDLVTQYVSVASADVDSMLSASAEVLAPYAPANLVLTVSEISTDSKGNATVTWSRSLNGTALKAGIVWTLPAAIVQPNTSYIYGQTTYNFTPIMGYTLIKSIPLTDQLYMSPRLSASVPCTGC